MRIALSSVGMDLGTDIDPRFGRCRYFLVVETEAMAFKALENSGVKASGGAGIAAAQQLIGEKVDALMTGHCGPNAFNVLNSAGVKVITGVSGKVEEAIKDYQAGKYEAATQANASPHAGMGRS